MTHLPQRFHFISGLPRSGSTLLSAILRQNPRFHAGVSSPVGAFFSSVLANVSAGSFPHGWFGFRLVGCTPGGTVRVSVTWPALAGFAYKKYGPTPASPATSIFYMPTNLTVSGTTAGFDVTDGGLGDSDLTANGVIVDPSGPLLLDIAAPLPVPALSLASLVALLIGLGLIPAGWGRRLMAKLR